MRLVWGSAAFLGLVLSLVVHMAASLDVDVYSEFPAVWILHFVALALVGAFVLSGGYRLKLDEVTWRLPTWAVLLMAVAIVYVVVNSLICASLSGEGNANVVDGQYVLTSHGRVLARISERDYHLHRAYELRLFSGIWTLSCLVATLYFLIWRDDQEAAV